MAPSRHISGLPMVPGNSVRDFSHADYRKRSTLAMHGGVMSVEDPNEVYKPREEILATTLARKLGITDVPEHVAFDGKVLRYECFFKEAVVESNQENYRVRRCVLLYYLLDGSVQVRHAAPPALHASHDMAVCVNEKAGMALSAALIALSAQERSHPNPANRHLLDSVSIILSQLSTYLPRARRSRSPSWRTRASRRARAKAPSSSSATASQSPTVRLAAVGA